MKNISKLLIALIAILSVTGCTTNDVQDRPVIAGIDSPQLIAPIAGATYVLLPSTMTQQVERFVWKSANYGGAVAITYTLQIDTATGTFATPQVFGGANGANQVSVTQQALNNACLTLGATPYAAANFKVRVMSTASGYAPMYSNVITIGITPYTTATPHLWMPGSYQSGSGYGTANWSHAAAPQLASLGYGNKDFEGYVYFNANQIAPSDGFKFTTQGDWNGTNYGDDGSFSGTLSATGGNIGVSAGYYKVNVNTNTLAYTLSPTTWSVIGNGALGWNPGNDVPMTYNPTTKKWTVTVTLSTQNAPNDGIKFRANNGWTLNYGDTGADGTLEEGGTNISTTAGSHVITLDLSNPRAYTYTIQ